MHNLHSSITVYKEKNNNIRKKSKSGLLAKVKRFLSANIFQKIIKQHKTKCYYSIARWKCHAYIF